MCCLFELAEGTPRGDAANALESRDLDDDGNGDGAGGVRRPPELREGHRRHHGGRGPRVQAGSKKSVNSERGNKKRDDLSFEKNEYRLDDDLNIKISQKTVFLPLKISTLVWQIIYSSSKTLPN